MALISSLLIALTINHPLAAVLERFRITPIVFYIYIVSLFSFVFLSLNITNEFLRYILIFVLILLILFSIYMYLKKWRKILIKNKEIIKYEWVDDKLIKNRLVKQNTDKKKFLCKNYSWFF